VTGEGDGGGRPGAVYLLPGLGDGLAGTLGRLIADAGFQVVGREVDEAFARLRFAEQVDSVGNDLRVGWWHAGARLIGRSYGGYLILHALADLPPFPGQILLFSPMLGPAVARDGWYISRPPRSVKLLKRARAGEFPPPNRLEIHTGKDDLGCDPWLATQIANGIETAELHLVIGAGHDLGEAYTRTALSRFLGSS
jgi:hypothetical protein